MHERKTITHLFWQVNSFVCIPFPRPTLTTTLLLMDNAAGFTFWWQVENFVTMRFQLKLVKNIPIVVLLLSSDWHTASPARGYLGSWIHGALPSHWTVKMVRWAALENRSAQENIIFNIMKIVDTLCRTLCTTWKQSLKIKKHLENEVSQTNRWTDRWTGSFLELLNSHS